MTDIETFALIVVSSIILELFAFIIRCIERANLKAELKRRGVLPGGR